SPIQYEGADEAAGSVAICLQHLRERDLLVADVELTVVADAVKRRKSAGQERRVRRQRQRCDGRGVNEAKSTCGEPVGGGRRGGLVTVTAEAIRAQRIDCYQKDVQPARALTRRTEQGDETGRDQRLPHRRIVT